MKIKHYIWNGIGAALAIFGVLLFYQAYQASQRNADLEDQLKELTEKEKRSAILRSISTQMEEIANQQKAVSDQQREEAEQQTLIANEMRQQSEIEKRNAQDAERSALASERRALEASEQAESQRLVAEQQREQAEYSRSVADTLSYLALARTLGATAVTQENTGNHELALLLAYTSYLFTERYQGDLYQPAIYEALSLLSKSSNTWPAHHGAVKKIYMTNSERTRFVSISDYGELVQHELLDGQLKSKYLFQNNQFDIRDMWVFDNGMIYVLSRSSDLLLFSPNKATPVIKHIDNAVHPMRLYAINNMEIVVVAENGLFVFEQGNLELKRSLMFDSPITLSSNNNGSIILFDKTDVVKVVNDSITSYTKARIPVKEVTAVSRGRDNKAVFYGTTDGTIYMVKENGQTTRMVGHRSRVSQLSRYPLDNQLVISSSYDGTVKIWDSNKEKIEPINVLTSGAWVTCLMMVGGDYMWTGDQRGNLTQTVISVPLMVSKIKESLTRNYTREEWNYYIGSSIPYESFK